LGSQFLVLVNCLLQLLLPLSQFRVLGLTPPLKACPAHDGGQGDVFLISQFSVLAAGYMFFVSGCFKFQVPGWTMPE
jgi:hypothetical protein